MDRRDEYVTWLEDRLLRPEPWHDHRFVETMCLLDQTTEHKRVLEFGDGSVFTELMKYAWPNAYIANTGAHDVRTFSTEERFDTVVIMEVIEHVHDVPTQDYDKRARWTGSGQVAMLHNAAACLSPGGRLLVTTPNACGFGVLWRVLHQLPPRSYDPHVRELTPTELRHLVSVTGLKHVDEGQWLVWRHHGLTDAQMLMCAKLIERCDQSPDRGDCIYHLSQKD